MNDAIALLAISQLVCLAALIYLYTQVQALRSRTAARRVSSGRARPMARSVDMAAAQSASQAARTAYGSNNRAQGPARRADTAAIAARMSELGVDIPALARRMHKSEEEVRLLLRRGAVTSQELAR
jgi:hypothetical protein